jgi:c-di-GMP-binding flagellar brake protein YcgR
MPINHEKTGDRRRYKRVKVQPEAYAVFRAPQPMLGQIIDISEGGVGILYVEGDRMPTHVVEFDLFTLNNDVKVNAIAAVARSDQKLPMGDPDNPETRRRRGIEFIGLLEGQREAVREFMLRQTGHNGDNAI